MIARATHLALPSRGILALPGMMIIRPGQLQAKPEG